MKIQPDYDEIRAAAAARQYKVYPIHCELLSDFCTPIEALRILKNVSTHCFLLESILDREKWGRYTFLGFDPKLEITCRGGVLKVGSLCIQTDDPAAYLRQVLADYKSPQLPGLPTFTGGLVGYFSYDYLGYSEPSVRSQAADSENFKDVDLMLFDKVIAFDNLRQKNHPHRQYVPGRTGGQLQQGRSGAEAAGSAAAHRRKKGRTPRAAHRPGHAAV